MEVVLVVAVFVIGAVLLAFATFAAVTGLVGIVTGERFERCPVCHHRGLTARGRRHADGCPHTVHLHVPRALRLHHSG